jgi:hypothetical protein
LPNFLSKFMVKLIYGIYVVATSVVLLNCTKYINYQPLGENSPGSMVWSQFSAIFNNFWRTKFAFFSKTNVMIKFLHKLALFWVKNVFKNHNIGPSGHPGNKPTCPLPGNRRQMPWDVSSDWNRVTLQKEIRSVVRQKESTSWISVLTQRSNFKLLSMTKNFYPWQKKTVCCISLGCWPTKSSNFLLGMKIPRPLQYQK